MPKKRQEPILYEDVFRELYKNKIRYLVVGGVAVVLHGYQRFTKDMDLMLSLNKNNVLKFTRMITKLGYRPIVPVPPESLADTKTRNRWIKEKGAVVFHFQHPSKLFERIDVFLKNPIPFMEAYSRKKTFKVRRFEVSLISIKDLVYLKKLADRPMDRFDIQALNNIVYRQTKE